MDSRTRVLTALRHEEPDRIPIDVGSTPNTAFHVFVYRDLRRVLNLPEKPIRIFDFGQQLAEVEKELLDYFHADIININRTLEPCAPYPSIWRYRTRDGKVVEISDREWKVWVHRNGAVIEIPKAMDIIEEEDGGYVAYVGGDAIGRMPKDGYYFWGLDRYGEERPPLAEVKTVDDIEKFNWEYHRVSSNYVDVLRRRAEYLHRNTEYALIFTVAGSLHEWGQGLRGWNRWLSDLRIRKPLAEAMLDHMMDVLRYNVERYVDALNGYVHIIGFSDDFGTEEGPQISVQTFREFYKHRYEELFNIVKRRSKMYIYLHSCGSIYPLIKEFIDVGVDILNPVQISARGMDPVVLKRDFGEQIVFWGGGVDTQHILPFAKEEEVIEHVKKLIEIFKPGGGYIYAPVHNIQPNTPPQNIIAIYTTAYKYGKYTVR
ncbi:MAG: uroporphyrinogen decarboxylase family protein [Ignisphaera sp.]